MPFLPLSEISAYGRKNWVIKARVSSKAAVRTFKRNNGEGKILKVELLDSEGTEIACTFWNEAAEKYGATLTQGQVYTFSGGQAKLANKKFTTIQHNYELSFDEKAQVSQVEDDTEIGQVKFSNITPLRELANKQVPTNVNVLVVVKEIQPKRSITTKSGEERALRKLMVVDTSECSIEMTMWGEAANLPDDRLAVGTVIGVKGMRLGDWGGRSGSAQDVASLFFDMTTPEFVQVRDWWANTGQSVQVRALSSEVSMTKPGTIVKEGSLDEFNAEAEKLQSDQTVYFNTKGYFGFCKTKGIKGDIPLWYEACPDCNRKALDGQCMKCNKTVTAVPRYALGSMLLTDSTSERWVGAFDDAAISMLGMKADQMKSKTGGMTEQVDQLLMKEYFLKEFNLRLRANIDTYEGTSRVRAQVMQATPIDYKADGLKQLEEVKALYEGASENAQLEVRDLMSAWAGLQAKEQVADSWKTGFDNVSAVAAC